MATQPQVNVRMGGVDRSNPPWLLGEDVWYDALNMHTVNDKLRMYPRRHPRYITNNLQPITAMVQAAAPGRGWGTIYGFSTGAINVINELDAPHVISVPTATTVEVPRLTHTPGNVRWSTVLLDGKVFFTNPYNQVRYLEGGIVGEWDGNVPCGVHLEAYYDHLMIANVTFRGSRFSRRVMWSDLYKVGNWQPQRKNEADHYDCDETVFGGGALDEITGLKRLGDRIVMYTPSMIYVGGYVGLPRVMRIDPLIPGVGCDYRYGLVSIGRVHFFPCKAQHNFFSFNGEEVKPVGAKIANYFFDDVNRDIDLEQATWGYYNSVFGEVGFVYVSKAQNTLRYDKIVVLNINTGAWWPLSAENVSSYLEIGRPALTTADFNGTTPDSFAGYTLEAAVKARRATLVASYGQNFTEIGPRLWGDLTGCVLEETPSQSWPIVAPSPYLESPDFVYGNPQAVKEVSSMSIHAGSSDSVALDVSVRAGANDTVTFVRAPQAWNATLPEGRLSFPRTAGKFLRYRFSPNTSDFNGWTPVDMRYSRLIEVPTKIYRKFETEISGTQYPKTMSVLTPANGDVSFILVGSGGGGAVKSLATLNTYTFAADADNVLMTRITSPKRLRKTYQGTLGDGQLVVNVAAVGGGVFQAQLFLLDAGANPNNYFGMTSAVEQAFHDTMTADVLAAYDILGRRVEAWLAFYFHRLAGGFQGLSWTNWLNGNDTIEMVPAGSWGVFVKFAYFTSNRGRYSGGGGSGAFFAGKKTMAAYNKLFVATVYPPTDGALDGDHLDGGDGGAAVLYDQYNDATYIAGGGTGAKVNAGVLAAGAGGTVTNPGSVTVGKSTSGDAGTLDSPASGWPITTPAKAGRPWYKDGSQGPYLQLQAKGGLYGGGGVGGADPYTNNLVATKGAFGYAKIGWRVHPDTGLLVSLGGFPNLSIRKTVDGGAILSHTIQSGAKPGVISGNVDVRAAGVVELATFNQPPPLGQAFAYNPTSNLTPEKLGIWLVATIDQFTSVTLGLNHAFPMIEGCVEFAGWGYWVATAWPVSYTLNCIVPADQLVWEPCDANGVQLPYWKYSSRHEAQSLQVLIQHTTQLGVTSFEFAGFIPNIHANNAEK